MSAGDYLYGIQTGLTYVFGFIALYVQIFVMLILYRQRKEIAAGTVIPADVDWPAVTVIIPCWNEEETVVKTVESMLAIDYPKDKLIIKVIDDGSTDGTWERAQVFKDIPNVHLHRKENGGKHTAMNYAIAHTTTDFVGNLDADAFIEKDTLKKTMWQFLNDPEMMAVSPAVVIHEPQNALERAQAVEFDIFILVKKALGSINGIHVTQGQFSMYRKKVFDELGPYQKAHQTEDLEIAYRMHANGYKIGQCHDAFVHTVAMDTLPTLFKQRLRWVYGFLNNSYDYRQYLLKPKYGAFSMFSVPMGLLYLVTTLFSTVWILWTIGRAAYDAIVRLLVTNFYVSYSAPSLFYTDTRPVMLITLILLAFFLASVALGKVARGKKIRPDLSMVYFFILSNFIATAWLGKALYNTLVSRKEVLWR
jgi:cellulose synthase/poly-beta-1,6-N-acetylglucosamine synthase-like glycosyltransferase